MTGARILAVHFTFACSLGMPGAAQTRSSVTPPPCTDSAGLAVRYVVMPAGSLGGYGRNPASATIDDRGQPVIRYAKSVLDQKSPVLQRFVFAHECAHHALGHVYRYARANTRERAIMEDEADCHGFRTLGYGRREIEIIAREEAELLQPLTLPEGSISWSKPSRRTVLESCLNLSGN